jgi:membrane associated rhomboid family serine protease
LGYGRFLVLLLLATLAGDCLHAAADPRSTIPCVGASGGISGVLVFYALKFPHARLGFFWRLRWLHLPAWGALVLWLLWQSVGVLQQVSGIGNVSAIAHLGGAAVGLLFWLKWRRQ